MGSKNVRYVLYAVPILLVLSLIIVVGVGISSGAFANILANKSVYQSSQSANTEQSIDSVQSIEVIPGIGEDEGCIDKEQSIDDDPEHVQNEPTNCETTTVNHLVTAFDTLSKISREYNISVETIAKENDISDVNLIYTDSILRIPLQKATSE